MKEQILTGWEEFTKYVKKEFGYDMTLVESSKPDSFETIFGGSFFAQDEEKETIQCVYTGDSASVFLADATDDWNATQEMVFAAWG